MSVEDTVAKFNEIGKKFIDLIGEMDKTWHEHKSNVKKLKAEPTQKRVLPSISQDWSCDGRLWESKPCEGCKRCNTKKIIVFDRTKKTMCGSCKLDYEKFKKTKRQKTKEEVAK